MTGAPRWWPRPTPMPASTSMSGPLFQTPEEAARMAVENDVHVVGVSSLAAGHKTLVPQLAAALKELGAEDIAIVCGGVIPRQDYEALYAAGAARIFGPGTPIVTSAGETLAAIEEQTETEINQYLSKRRGGLVSPPLLFPFLSARHRELFEGTSSSRPGAFLLFSRYPS